MKVVDLRNLFANCNDQLIEVCGDLIYYSEEKHEEGHHNLFVLEYNQKARRERILTSYFLNKPTFVQHFYSFQNEILLVLEDGKNEMQVHRIDKHTGRELASARFSLTGSFADCTALDEERLLVYTTADEEHARMFEEYRSLTGFPYVVVLYDLGDRSCSYLRDPRICAVPSGSVVPYKSQEEYRLLVLQPGGTEEDRRVGFANTELLEKEKNDNVWSIPLLDFIVSAKAEEPRVPLELIFSVGTAGMVRYAGMSKEMLFFRMEQFAQNDCRLCAVKKSNAEKYIAAKLSLLPGVPAEQTTFRIDAQNERVYRITEKEDTLTVDALYGAQIHAEYKREFGSLLSTVDDRFLVTQTVLADENDSFAFQFVCDTQTGEQQSYEGNCVVEDDTIILY